MEKPSATPPVGSVETTLDIIEAIRDLDGAGVTELATELDIPKSTVHNHLNTLEQNEYLVREGDSYRTGLRFLGLGEYTRTQLPIYEVAKPKIEELANETEEMANLAVEEHGRGVYLIRGLGDQAVHLDTYDGKRVYMHSTAHGKAMLSQMSAEEVEAIIDRHGLPASTDSTVTTKAELFEELERIEERGFAYDKEERLQGLRCVAAPIVANDSVIGAVSVTGPTSRMKGDRFHEEIPELVSDAANVIAINLTYL